MNHATVAAPVRCATPRASRRHKLTHVSTVMLGFVVAVAAFVGSTLYAETRLVSVARSSREVAVDAMPSVVQLGKMRREVEITYRIVREASAGRSSEWPELREHLTALDEARASYESLPHFAGDELGVWRRARSGLDESLRLAYEVELLVEAGALPAAAARTSAELDPAKRTADDALEELTALDEGRGTRLASEAGAVSSRARLLAFLLDGVSVVVTAAFAAWARRRVYRHDAVERRRYEELEAFASRVAHDLRGPLMPASLALQSISRQPGTDGDGSKRRAMAERGLRSLLRVESLVRDLLAFARMGTEPEPGAHAGIKPAMDGVAEDLEPQAQAARVRLVVEDLPDCEVACPSGVLSSILSNLVGNAIKYMPEQAQQREVRVRAAQRNGFVRVEVADTGAGLAPDEQARIFEPYVRLDPRKPGLGLGLTTVRRLVEMCGGKVGVRSRRGEGATFWFEIPVSRGCGSTT